MTVYALIVLVFLKGGVPVIASHAMPSLVECEEGATEAHDSFPPGMMIKVGDENKAVLDVETRCVPVVETTPV